MIVADALRSAAALLAQTSETARLDAELLMAHALGVSRSQMLMHSMQHEVPPAFEALLREREASRPIAQIIGSQEFYGLEFEVNSDVLIPRGDSECIVEAALECAPNAKRVLDCGTGSGALLIAVLHHLPDAVGIGIDRSSPALGVAQRNAERLGLDKRTKMLPGDWNKDGWASDLGSYDLILANPPYVEAGADLAPDVSLYEPHEALFAGSDGLDDYRKLIPQLRGLMNDPGLAVLEIGANQADAVTVIGQAHGFACEVRHDLANRPRAVVLRS